MSPADPRGGRGMKRSAGAHASIVVVAGRPTKVIDGPGRLNRSGSPTTSTCAKGSDVESFLLHAESQAFRNSGSQPIGNRSARNFLKTRAFRNLALDQPFTTPRTFVRCSNPDETGLSWYPGDFGLPHRRIA